MGLKDPWSRGPGASGTGSVQSCSLRLPPPEIIRVRTCPVGNASTLGITLSNAFHTERASVAAVEAKNRKQIMRREKEADLDKKAEQHEALDDRTMAGGTMSKANTNGSTATIWKKHSGSSYMIPHTKYLKLNYLIPHTSRVRSMYTQFLCKISLSPRRDLKSN